MKKTQKDNEAETKHGAYIIQYACGYLFGRCLATLWLTIAMLKRLLRCSGRHLGFRIPSVVLTMLVSNRGALNDAYELVGL